MIAIVDYKAGNLTSVQLALKRLGRESVITGEAEEILSAERVVFPGVGAMGAAMENLRGLGLDIILPKVIEKGTPFLGICVGTQILLTESEEDGRIKSLNIIPGTVRRFRPSDHFDKIPQMGWNAVRFVKDHPVLAGLDSGGEYYFVHSYYPAPDDPDMIIGRTGYADVDFASIAGRENVIATQFHPEKSGKIGLKLLDNFCTWDGKC